MLPVRLRYRKTTVAFFACLVALTSLDAYPENQRPVLEPVVSWAETLIDSLREAPGTLASFRIHWHN